MVGRDRDTQLLVGIDVVSGFFFFDRALSGDLSCLAYDFLPEFSFRPVGTENIALLGA